MTKFDSGEGVDPMLTSGDMRRGLAVPFALALACLASAPACMFGGSAKSLSIDPDRRGFEVPGHPVILFFVDGLRKDILDDVAASDKLPRLSRHLFDRGARVRSALSGVPSVTYANATSMLTGCWPSTHGVWANVWFDRDALRTCNYETQRDKANEDSASPMIFEMIPKDLTATVSLAIHRGAKITLADSVTTGGTLAWLNWYAKREEKADELLAEQLFEIGEQAREIGEWPAFIAVHLPAVDHIGHVDGSDSEAYRSAVENLDESIGGALDAFARGGMLESMTIVLTSDHGHHGAPLSFALDRFLPQAIGTPALPSQENDGTRPFLERWGYYTSTNVVFTVTGEREASLHLRVHGEWKDRSSLAEILAFPEAPGEAARASPLPERLLQSPAVDVVVVRAGENSVQVHGRRGIAVIERSPAAADPLFSYSLLKGEDPLGYFDDAGLQAWIKAGAHASREWLESTAEQAHPDLVPQLLLAFDHRRSGDVILFAAPGWDFSTKYRGGHGGIEREEMIVPLFFAGPGIRAGVEIKAARLVDIVPTLLDLTGTAAPAGARFDGVTLADFLR
ncbi:MAG: alkaline phosphatase family protein [Planctomycetota bacterium]